MGTPEQDDELKWKIISEGNRQGRYGFTDVGLKVLAS